jgi:hypothetical protein
LLVLLQNGAIDIWIPLATGWWWQPPVASVIGPTCQRLNLAIGVVMSLAHCYMFLGRTNKDIIWRIKMPPPPPPRWTSLTTPIGNAHYVRWRGGPQHEAHARCWRGGIAIVILGFYAKTKYSSYAWYRINCSAHTGKSVHR